MAEESKIFTREIEQGECLDQTRHKKPITTALIVSKEWNPTGYTW